VSDVDFRKIVAILRLAVPYTGIIMSTRETPNIRRETFALGVSQISAGSRTNPGGYAEADATRRNRASSSSAITAISTRWCATWRRWATSRRSARAATASDAPAMTFMDLAKPGAIKLHCDPNALSTFTEYLEDYASPETRKVGEALVASTLANMDARQREISEGLVRKVKGGKRDVFV